MSIRDSAAGFVIKLISAIDCHQGECMEPIVNNIVTLDGTNDHYNAVKLAWFYRENIIYFLDKGKFKLLILDTLLSSTKQGLSSNSEVRCYFVLPVTRQ